MVNDLHQTQTSPPVVKTQLKRSGPSVSLGWADLKVDS